MYVPNVTRTCTNLPSIVYIRLKGLLRSGSSKGEIRSGCLGGADEEVSWHEVRCRLQGEEKDGIVAPSTRPETQVYGGVSYCSKPKALTCHEQLWPEPKARVGRRLATSREHHGEARYGRATKTKSSRRTFHHGVGQSSDVRTMVASGSLARSSSSWPRASNRIFSKMPKRSCSNRIRFPFCFATVTYLTRPNFLRPARITTTTATTK